jgi:hypothetical protein
MTGTSISRERAPGQNVSGQLAESSVPSSDTVLCRCGHTFAEHDAIGTRFCAASAGGDLARGCVCGPVPAHSGRELPLVATGRAY